MDSGMCMQSDWRHVHAERLALETYACAEHRDGRWHVHAERLALEIDACAEQSD